MERTRRAVLSGLSVAVLGSVAGCVGGGDSEDSGPQEVDWDQSSDVNEGDIQTPTLLFSFNHRQGDDVVGVSHAGGRSVSASNLFIRGEGLADGYNRTAFPELPESEISSGDDFGTGGAVDVAVTGDQFRIEVVWVDSETNYPVTLEEFSVGMDG
jgi:hypothetical protein